MIKKLYACYCLMHNGMLFKDAWMNRTAVVVLAEELRKEWQSRSIDATWHYCINAVASDFTTNGWDWDDDMYDM